MWLAGGTRTNTMAGVQVEGIPRQVLEEQERKEAAKKLEELKKKDMPAALMKINRLRGGEVSSCFLVARNMSFAEAGVVL